MKKALKLTVASFALIALAAVAALAQTDVSGTYTGTAKTAGAADTPLTLELKNEGGKITGSLKAGADSIEISDATLADGKLSLKLGPVAKNGVLTAKVNGDTLTGEWISGAQKKTVELKKGTATASTTAPATVNLSGQWDAVADASGESFPFLLTLKVDGDKVTGGSSSQLGESTIKEGSWKDGKLAFQLDGGQGLITMSATLVDGKLTGEFDYAGQLQGKWVAVKKN
ncbi:MAG TPA: hypothetical protein VI306_21745 [Pyrinomonadaceae bacterium]